MLPIVVLPGLLILSLAAPLPPGRQADLIVENATIYTVNKAQPKVRSLAVKAGRILAVGDDLSAYAGPATRRLDLHGATVVPGLIDSHGHMEGLGGLLESADLRHVRTVAEVAEYVRKQALQRKPGEWIVGRNWDQTNWGGQFPAARDLDGAAPANPVFLSRVDGHAGWANSAALKLAGVTPQTPDPSGGRIVKDAQGQPTGIFVDNAMSLVESKIPPATAAQIRRRLELAAKECARVGLTTVHDAGVFRVGSRRLPCTHRRGQASAARLRDDRRHGAAVAQLPEQGPRDRRATDGALHQAVRRRSAWISRRRALAALHRRSRKHRADADHTGRDREGRTGRGGSRLPGLHACHRRQG